ncbi:MAG: hypothetical protein A4E58_02462 [Syntrophorhabdus sp. PtaB.Bin006]|nr:MAG: hypothetical protein A4E58_02462 [Syntrophorhabdus sp. PtaB.Bin006]
MFAVKTHQLDISPGISARYPDCFAVPFFGRPQLGLTLVNFAHACVPIGKVWRFLDGPLEGLLCFVDLIQGKMVLSSSADDPPLVPRKPLGRREELIRPPEVLEMEKFDFSAHDQEFGADRRLDVRLDGNRFEKTLRLRPTFVEDERHRPPDVLDLNPLFLRERKRLVRHGRTEGEPPQREGLGEYLDPTLPALERVLLEHLAEPADHRGPQLFFESVPEMDQDRSKVFIQGKVLHVKGQTDSVVYLFPCPVEVILGGDSSDRSEGIRRLLHVCPLDECVLIPLGYDLNDVGNDHGSAFAPLRLCGRLTAQSSGFGLGDCRRELLRFFESIGAMVALADGLIHLPPAPWAGHDKVFA